MPKEEIEKIPEKIPEWAKEIIESNNLMRDKLEEQEEEIRMLKDLEGKNKIASYKEGQLSNDGKTAFLRLWKDKIVIGWDKLDMSQFNSKAPDAFSENIYTTLYFLDDDKPEKVNYVEFNSSPERITVKIIDVNRDMAKIEFPDGKILDLPIKFLNP